jgi:hypothetical protein
MGKMTPEEERDALLTALGFLPGPFKDDLTQKIILDDAAGLRPEMARARSAEMQLQSDLEVNRLIVATNLRQWVRKRFGVWITWKSAWAATDDILPEASAALSQGGGE